MAEGDSRDISKMMDNMEIEVVFTDDNLSQTDIKISDSQSVLPAVCVSTSRLNYSL